MANSQMLTSKKPSNGARTFHPRAIKIVRIVTSVTTIVSAKKTRVGKLKMVGTMELSSRVTGSSPHRKCDNRPSEDGAFGHDEEDPYSGKLVGIQVRPFQELPRCFNFSKL